MKKVILPPELSEEFIGLRFIPYGDMMVRIMRDNIRIEDPVDEIHKAASRIMEYNSPNLIVSAFSFRYWTGRHEELEGTLIFIDPEIIGSKPEWDGVCGPK